MSVYLSAVHSCLSVQCCRDRSNTKSDRWSATAAHVRKRIQSTKRHTKGAIRKKYNDIVTKRQEKDTRRPGNGKYPCSLRLAVLKFTILNIVAVAKSVFEGGTSKLDLSILCKLSSCRCIIVPVSSVLCIPVFCLQCSEPRQCVSNNATVSI